MTARKNVQMNINKPVVDTQNGKLTAFGKWSAGIMATWVTAITAGNLHLYQWRAATEANRFTDEDARVMRQEINVEIMQMRNLISSLPPPDWRERIRELEKWRIQHLQNEANDGNRSGGIENRDHDRPQHAGVSRGSRAGPEGYGGCD